MLRGGPSDGGLAASTRRMSGGRLTEPDHARDDDRREDLRPQQRRGARQAGRFRGRRRRCRGDARHELPGDGAPEHSEGARPDKIAVIFDHMVPAADRRSAEAHSYGREFVRRFGIKRFHDVGPEQGISHAVVADRAYALPGTVLVCSDSHTCASGAFNCAARGIGAPDLLAAITVGQTWFRVGETIRYDLSGRFQRGVSAKDLFLYLAGVWGQHTNQNVEFGGPALPGLGIDARRTLAAMGAELGAEFATF